MEEMREIMKRMFPVQMARRAQGDCPFCGRPVRKTAFRDEISLKEFGISGLCQSCQDKTFGEEE